MPAFSGKFDTVVIIVSTGRTGTMALARHFDACYEQVKAMHEPRPSRRLRILSNKFLCGKLSREALVRGLVRSRQRLLAGIAEPVYIEANNFLHGFLGAFEEVFDRPRIVHVVRDPRTYIRSWINFGVFRGLKGLAGRYYPYWLLKPELYQKDTPRRWSRMSPPERVAWYWNAINRELNRGEQLYGERYRRVRFENLFAKDGAELLALARWMGLPEKPQLVERAGGERINPSRDGRFPPWEQLDRQTRQAILQLCGSLMVDYGYPSSA